MDDSGKFVLQPENCLKLGRVTLTLQWRMTSMTENNGSDFNKGTDPNLIELDGQFQQRVRTLLIIFKPNLRVFVIELPPKAIKITEHVCITQCTSPSFCHENKVHRGGRGGFESIPYQPFNPVAISGQSHVFLGNNNTEARAIV